jgi:acetoacetyl-CoA synthetase
VKRRLTARRRRRVLTVRIPYSDILYCSAPELLSRHLEPVKLAILRRQRTAALVAEARLFPVQPRGILLPMPTCYRSRLPLADDLDRLYSELVLLPI